jgi:ATP/maltotriose-dependent transcriptional regulator MalT
MFVILPQTRLLERLIASEPRLVRLCAPAGYGKSSLARLFARRFDRHAICDCAGVCDAIEFADRAMSALAGESQGGDAIAIDRLRLHASEAGAEAWSRALLEAWKTRQERSLLIIENASAVAEDPGTLALLGDMLAVRPAERVLLLSSRTPLPLRVAHHLAPHQTLSLSSSELRFESEEAASIFEGTDLSPETVDRIVRLTCGWPIVLLLLARFAHYEADIEGLIDRLEGVAFGSLHEYLATEVLSELTPEMMSAMLAAAAIPHASLEDISAAAGIRHATAIIDGLQRLPGFILPDAGTYQPHPLLLGALRAHHADDFADYVLRAARENEGLGDYLRAAELYHSFGDDDLAAAALERLPAATLQAPSQPLIDVLVKIKMSTLCAYPNLWIATLRYRHETVDPAKLYDEAARLLQSISPQAAPSVHRRLRVRLAMLAQELERLAEARKLVESGEPAGSFEESPEEQRLILMTSAIVAAKQGRFSEADRFVEESDAVHGARHVRFDAQRAEIAMEKARFLGDWHGLLKMSEEALHAAQRSGVTPRIIEAAREVAWAAWYCNDDARAVAANQMLEDCGDTEVLLFARCVDAVLSGTPIGAPPRLLQLARWHAALAVRDVERSSELFDRAIDGIDSVENDFLRIAIRVCAALLLPRQRRRLLEARVIAGRIESAPLQASLELLIDSPEPADYGIFGHMAARAARSPLKVRQDVLFVDVLRGQVRRGAELLHVSDRGFELLVALALLPVGASNEELAGAIWPALRSEAALNALKMCVSRTRAQIAEKEAIRSTKGGYALGERVAIDVHEFERLLRGVRGAEALGDSVRRQVEEAAQSLGARQHAYATGWAWFAPHETRLDTLQREFTRSLERDASRRAGSAAAQAFAERLIDRARGNAAEYELKAP